MNERQVEPEHEVHEPEPEVDEMNDEYRKKRFRENPIVYERRKKMKLPSHQSPVTLSTDDGGQVGQKMVYGHPDVATCCLMSDDGGQSGHQEIQDKVDERHPDVVTCQKGEHVEESEMKQKKLLILDVNGVLADIVYGSTSKLVADSTFWNKSVNLRPHFQEFIDFCFEKFEVALWSSKQSHNLQMFIDNHLKGYNFYFIWDNTKCTRKGYIGKSQRPLFLKELKKVWEHYPHYNETNTLLIDDSPHKCSMNAEGSCIYPVIFSCNNKDNDIALGKDGELQIYLNELANAPSVPDFVRKNKLFQPPLSKEGH